MTVNVIFDDPEQTDFDEVTYAWVLPLPLVGDFIVGEDDNWRITERMFDPKDNSVTLFCEPQ